MAAMACLILAACKKKADDAAWWDGERERVELQSRLDLLKLRDSGASPDGVSELAAVRAEAGQLAQCRDRFVAERLELLADVEALESESAGLAAARLKAARASALGRQFARFSTVAGKTYEDVKVVKVDDGGVSIRHAHGAATLRYGDLTAAQREEFGLEQASALAAEMREARDTIEYEERMNREMAVVEQRRRELASIESMKSENDARRRASMARVEARDRESMLSRRATPFGSGSIWRSSWYGPYDYYYSDRRRTVTYYTPSSSWYPQYTYPSPSCGSSSGGTRPVEVRTPDPIRREVIR